MPYSLKYILATAALCATLFFGLNANAQASHGSVRDLIDKVNNYNTELPGEKLYLQFDKPYYSVGDTIWFKGYIFNPKLNYSPLSGRVYIDMVNDSNVVVKRLTFAASQGVTWGDIALDDAVFRDGTYTLRAYTNWMRNFGEESFYYKSFYFSNPVANTWLINSDFRLSAASKNNVEAKLQFKSLDKKPLPNNSLNIKVVNGKQSLSNTDVQLGSDGILTASFNLPDDAPLNKLAIIATEKQVAKKKAVVPVNINRAQDVDVQFLPEGGQLVTSLPGLMGFKAIGEDGRGIDIKGVILDNTQKEVASFASINKGMGVVMFIPQYNQRYTARVTLPNNQVKMVNLPAIRDMGTILSVTNQIKSDSITVTITVSDDLVRSGKNYQLIGVARGVVCYGASLNFRETATTYRIAKSAFPTGIAHFTLFNELNQPVNGRLTFIDHHDNLKIDVKTAKSYATRDSITMAVRVTDDSGQPVVGSFSMAVTDDKQVKRDGDNSANILTSVLITSELKGYVEDAAYYLVEQDKNWEALNALLLTQGWVSYNWNDVLAANIKPQFAAERQFEVKGKLKNFLGRPIAKSKVILVGSGKYNFTKEAETDKDGQFVFTDLPLIVDGTKLVLKAVNSKGNHVSNDSFKLDEVVPAPLVKLYNTPVKPWYVNTDSTLLNYITTNKNYQAKLGDVSFNREGKLLKAVTVKDRAAVKGSKNLNGAGESDQVITTDQLQNAGKISILDMLEKKVKGFRYKNVADSKTFKNSGLEFFVYTKSVHFVIDGFDIDASWSAASEGKVTNEHYDYQQQILDNISVEDVLGVEVLYSAKYSSAYDKYGFGNLNAKQLLASVGQGPGVGNSQVCYIEITTRSGNGPFMVKNDNLLVFKPAKVNMPNVFYRPRYTVKSDLTNFKDMRSTIYWQQQIFTDKDGKATVSYYAADNPTSYTVVIEGSDMKGKIGYKSLQIPIGK